MLEQHYRPNSKLTWAPILVDPKNDSFIAYVPKPGEFVKTPWNENAQLGMVIASNTFNVLVLWSSC